MDINTIKQKIQLHNLKTIGDGKMFHMPVLHENLTPGIYYWKDDQKNVFKALLIVGSYVVGVKQ